MGAIGLLRKLRYKISTHRRSNWKITSEGLIQVPKGKRRFYLISFPDNNFAVYVPSTGMAHSYINDKSIIVVNPSEYESNK